VAGRRGYARRQVLKSVGLNGVPPAVDILVTGLAIGSGTEPLHDLISNMQQSSSQKEHSARPAPHPLAG